MKFHKKSRKCSQEGEIPPSTVSNLPNLAGKTESVKLDVDQSVKRIIHPVSRREHILNNRALKLISNNKACSLTALHLWLSSYQGHTHCQVREDCNFLHNLWTVIFRCFIKKRLFYNNDMLHENIPLVVFVISLHVVISNLSILLSQILCSLKLRCMRIHLRWPGKIF